MNIPNFFTVNIEKTSDKLPWTYLRVEFLQQKGGCRYKTIESHQIADTCSMQTSFSNLPWEVAKPLYDNLKNLVGKTINEHEVLVQS